MQNYLKKNKLQVAIMGFLVATTFATSTYAQEALFDRAAKGDITEKGGATRLKGDQIESLRSEIEKQEVKNVILFIGDGMGDSEITIARNVAEGAGGMFKGLDALPFTGQYTHYALDEETHKPNYVTDSAASATAWSSGVKTFNGALAVDVNSKPHPTLIQLAKKSGLATGNVSTAEIQDATPAAQVAHVPRRKCYAPSATTEMCPDFALENGGLGSISEQLIDTRADVTLGGGAKSFNEVAKAGDYKGKSLLDQAKERGYIVVTTTEEMKQIQGANQAQPILGLFSDGNMPVRWKGPQATKGGALQEAIECKVNEARTDDIPTLAEMTNKAIELLSENENGFFLQVEGASIDKANHAANACGQIGETVDLDEAVQVGLEYAKKHGNTLIIVTADHAHSSQIVPFGADTPGLTQNIITKDGAPITIGYSTNVDNIQDLWPNMKLNDSMKDIQNHTGAQLRIAAYGPQAANVSGLLDQTDLFFIIINALELEK